MTRLSAAKPDRVSARRQHDIARIWIIYLAGVGANLVIPAPAVLLLQPPHAGSPPARRRCMPAAPPVQMSSSLRREEFPARHLPERENRKPPARASAINPSLLLAANLLDSRRARHD